MAVPLVSDEHDDHVGVGVLPGVLLPCGEVVEGVPPRNVVHEESPRGAPVVGTRNGTECFLTRLRTRTSSY